MRSNIAPWSAFAWDTRKDELDYDLIRRHLTELRKIVPYYWGDFYPLTGWSLEEDIWMAWQFDVPEKGEGMVQAFRRPKSPTESASYKLRGLNPKAKYELVDFDSGPRTQMTGAELMGRGLTVTMKQAPWAAIITYKRLK